MTTSKQPLLVMFLGLPGSGKSFFARQLAERLKAPRLNGDTMRMAMFGSVEKIEQLYNSKDRAGLNTWVFGAIDYAVEQFLMLGITVVYDAHHNMRSTRNDLELLASKCNAVPVLVWVKTPYEVALRRGQERTPLVDQRQLTEEKMREVMDRHQAQTDAPSDSEKVICVDGQQPFEEQFQDFLRQLEKITSTPVI